MISAASAITSPAGFARLERLSPKWRLVWLSASALNWSKLRSNDSTRAKLALRIVVASAMHKRHEIAIIDPRMEAESPWRVQPTQRERRSTESWPFR